MVKRVSALVGKGLTLKLALSLEKDPCINPDSWEKAINSHPEFLAPYQAAKADFLSKSIDKLAASTDLANTRWLLERRHWDLFARQPEIAVTVNNELSLANGKPMEEWDQTELEAELVRRGAIPKPPART